MIEGILKGLDPSKNNKKGRLQLIFNFKLSAVACIRIHSFLILLSFGNALPKY